MMPFAPSTSCVGLTSLKILTIVIDWHHIASCQISHFYSTFTFIVCLNVPTRQNEWIPSVVWIM
ncbi:hypothetical protein CLU79DRAFT_754409 [Phycomyces nitens]|nr:hypothetical protein CLU79DRAFT_754409 [Phycomyces nitens]